MLNATSRHDTNSNVTAYCDATKTQAMLKSWPMFTAPAPSPVPATCSNTTPGSSGNGITVYKWNNPTYEPDGELTNTYTPMGYHVSIQYNPANQEPGGTIDYGLPTQVAGQQYTQADGTARTPTQNFTYDPYGDLATYGSGNGTWTIQYDNKNQVIMREDPDGVSSYTCYYHDLSVQFTETAYQHSLDGGSSNPCTDSTTQNAVHYTYDGDGDVVTETHRHGGTYVAGGTATLGNVGATVKYYDGLDRLVEVVEPYDSNSDIYQNAWMTRYLYDLTQWDLNGGTSDSASSKTVSFRGNTYSGYGNLYKTEELLKSGGGSSLSSTPGTVDNTSWIDIKAQGFDALDRMTDRYAVVGGSVSDDTLTYDSSDSYGNVGGLLAKQCNQLIQCQKFNYNARNAMSVFNSPDASAPVPQRTYTYDPDGRVTTITSAAFTGGDQTYTYDADGHELTSTDPKGATNQSESAGGSKITHTYYPDGKLECVDVNSSVLIQTGCGPSAYTSLFTYDYRPDGRTKTEVIDDSNATDATSPGTTKVSYTYSNAGRLQQRAESGVGANAADTNLTYNAFGQLVSKLMPQTTLNQYEFSAEGETLGVNSTTKYYGGALSSGTWTYNIRGEVTSSPPTLIVGGSLGSYATSTTMYANGTPIEVPTGTTSWGGGTSTRNVVSSLTWDDKRGVNLGASYGTYAPKLTSTTTSAWGYDGAGRLTSESSDTKPLNDAETKWTLTRTFDAENHETDNGNIIWGPNGHPSMVSTGGGKFQTLHWDGDQLLFTSELRSGSGVLIDIKVGSDGDITPEDSAFHGLTFYDRGPGGLVLGCHNKQGTTYVGLSDARAGEFIPSNPVCSTKVTPGTANFPSTIQWSSSPGSAPNTNGSLAAVIAPGTVLGMPRPDGYAWGLGTFQGARTFDSSAGTWTTPDAYAGDVHDPASQKSYMWNGNNAVSYSDPTGFQPVEEQEENLPPTESPAYADVEDDQLVNQEEKELTSGAIDRANIQKAIDNPSTPSRWRNVLQRALQGKYGNNPGSSDGTPKGDFSKSDGESARNAPSCSACGESRNPNGPRLQADHVKPKVQNGGNTAANLPLCRSCNGGKGGQTPLQWVQSLINRFSGPP